VHRFIANRMCLFGAFYPGLGSRGQLGRRLPQDSPSEYIYFFLNRQSLSVFVFFLSDSVHIHKADDNFC
jgi:hypothetical protein